MAEAPPGVVHTPSLPPTTTAQEDLVVARQSNINLIWEFTQAVLAVVVTGSTMIVAVYMAVSQNKFEVPNVLSNTMFLIVGFYFSRTNHANIGGIGRKRVQEYIGR